MRRDEECATLILAGAVGALTASDLSFEHILRVRSSWRIRLWESREKLEGLIDCLFSMFGGFPQTV